MSCDRHPFLPLRACITNFIDTGSYLMFDLCVEWLGLRRPKRVIPIALQHPHRKAISQEDFSARWWPSWTSDGRGVVITHRRMLSNAAFVEFKHVTGNLYNAAFEGPGYLSDL